MTDCVWFKNVNVFPLPEHQTGLYYHFFFFFFNKRHMEISEGTSVVWTGIYSFEIFN